VKNYAVDKKTGISRLSVVFPIVLPLAVSIISAFLSALSIVFLTPAFRQRIAGGKNA
jgi:hypothetical protein